MLQWHKWETSGDYKACRSTCGRYVVRRRYKVRGIRLTNAQRHALPFEPLTVAQQEGRLTLVPADPMRITLTSEAGAKRICQQAEEERLAVLAELQRRPARTLFQSQAANG